MYEPDMVREAYNKINRKDILCIIRRLYDEKGPYVLVDIIAPEHLKNTADYFQALKPNWHSALKDNWE